jgi:hypothetical protein
MLEATVLDITDKRRDQRKRFGGAVRKYLSLQGATGTEPNETALDTAFAILDDKTPPKTFKDLTLSEYTQLLLHKSRASYYRSVFNFDADAIRHLMDEVRNTRNDLAHFRQEITTSQRKQLHFCSEWLDRHPVPEPTISGTEPKTDQETPSAESTLELPETQALPEQQEIIPVEEALGPKDSRYAPLALWLQGQPVDQDRVMLTLEQIEGIINSPLPPSARQHRSWWANAPVSRVQSQQWLEVGWRVSYINITEGRITFARIIEREKAYIDFFGALIAKLQEVATFPVWSPAPNGSNWNSVTGLPEVQPQLTFVYSFARSHRFRIEIYIDTGDSVRNKQIFDRLHAQKTEIEATIGEELSWERLDNRRASRIALYRDGAITDDADKLASLRKWAVDAMIRFYDTLAKPTSDILKAVL